MFEAFGWLDGFLEGNNYIAGSTVTIADLFAVSTMLSIVVSCVVSNYNKNDLHSFTVTETVTCIWYENFTFANLKHFFSFRTLDVISEHLKMSSLGWIVVKHYQDTMKMLKELKFLANVLQVD